jgi:hypothetical protein
MSNLDPAKMLIVSPPFFLVPSAAKLHHLFSFMSRLTTCVIFLKLIPDYYATFAYVFSTFFTYLSDFLLLT